MMKKIVTLGAVLLVFSMMGTGYALAAESMNPYPAMSPVPPPSPGSALKVDNLLVIADVSRSMADAGKITTEKAFLASFNGGIPNGLKNAGLRTFGQSAYHHTVMIQPLQKYDRAAMAGLIEGLMAGTGNTPLASALVKAQTELEESAGPIAILVVSDGMNLSRDPIAPAMTLKEMYGDRLCIHVVHVGDFPKGRETLQKVAGVSECGIALAAAELQSKDAMTKFIADVFYELRYRDSDGDGVPDNLDKCPNTPKGVKVDKRGCPLDSDGDGVPDYLDKCPNTPKGVKVDKNGCPLDSDGDGVPDYLDQCPETPKGVEVDAHGCWIAAGLKFDYNKWDIKPEYYSGLDRGVRVLNLNSQMKVEIQGHTDGIGSDAYNQPLSEKRANAVRDYFISKGIDPNRLTVKGMGKSDPVASNDTPEGRAENRRVEFNIISR